MTYQRILDDARAGQLKPTDVNGLRWSIKPGFPAILCVEVVDDRMTNITRWCVPMAQLTSREMGRIARRFDPIDDV